MAQFSDTDKSSLRWFLGYPDITSGASSVAGVLMVSEVQNELEYVMNNVSAGTIARVQGAMLSLDAIEVQMVDALDRVRALKADVVTLNPDEHPKLQAQHRYWVSRICSVLAVKVNPGAAKPGIGISVKVNRRR